MSADPVAELSVSEAGLAARILLAYADGDDDQINRLINADLTAAASALVTFGGALAAHAWRGDAVRVLTELAIAADLDSLGGGVTG